MESINRHLDVHNFMREKKETVECNTINPQREIICLAVGFHKILTGFLFNMFNIFDFFP